MGVSYVAVDQDNRSDPVHTRRMKHLLAQAERTGHRPTDGEIAEGMDRAARRLGLPFPKGARVFTTRKTVGLLRTGGTKNPRTNTLRALAAYFDVPVVFLMEDTPTLGLSADQLLDAYRMVQDGSDLVVRMIHDMGPTGRHMIFFLTEQTWQLDQQARIATQ